MDTERLRRLRAAVAEYEREFGEISAEEIATQERSDRDDATLVRDGRRWVGRSEFAATVLVHPADAGLADDLDVLAGEMTDEQSLS